MAKDKRAIVAQCESIRDEIKTISGSDPEELKAALDAIVDSVELIESEEDELQDTITDLKDKVETLEEDNRSLTIELDAANEVADATHVTSDGNISFTPATSYDEDVMNALDDAVRHGRKLHLIEYLKAYQPDIAAYNNG